MTADLLRRAADRLVDLAGAAMLPPWALDRRDDGRAWINADGQEHALSLHGYPSTAAYIAAMHPPVGKALAAWLRAQAGYLDTCEDFGVPAGAGSSEATDLARLILGIAR